MFRGLVFWRGGGGGSSRVRCLVCLRVTGALEGFQGVCDDDVRWATNVPCSVSSHCRVLKEEGFFGVTRYLENLKEAEGA